MEVSTTSSFNVMCKSLCALGIDKGKVHSILNTSSKIVKSSGPSYLVKRIKELMDWRQRHIAGFKDFHPTWHRYSMKGNVSRPSSHLESLLWQFKDRTFFAICGCVTKSFLSKGPTKQQLQKWILAVRCENLSAKRSYNVASLPIRTLDRFEKQLVEKWSNRPWFGPNDITATSIPYCDGTFSTIRVDSKGNRNAADLAFAYAKTLETINLPSWAFLRDINYHNLGANDEKYQGIFAEDIGGNPTDILVSMANDPTGDYQSQSNSKFEQQLFKLMKTQQQDEFNIDLATMSSEFFPEPPKGKYPKDILTATPPLLQEAPIGRIGFIQEPGLKLRTVANPHRFVQWCNIPLGEVLSDYVKSLPGQYVYNQDQGKRWIQSQLRKGKELSSFDMSSATDYLDFKKFLAVAFQFVYKFPKRFPLLLRSLEYFTDCSQSSWVVQGEYADALGLYQPLVSWTVGQPLGLRPSFPLLSLMNGMFADAAIRRRHGNLQRRSRPYAVVGDDLVIETRYADQYENTVRAYNGQISKEKGVTSRLCAEFCSHIITKGSIIPKKPRWVFGEKGIVTDLERFSSSGLKPKVPLSLRQELEYLSGFHMGCSILPNIPQSKTAPLLERTAVNLLLKVTDQGDQVNPGSSLETIFNDFLEHHLSFERIPLIKEKDSPAGRLVWNLFGRHDSFIDYLQKTNPVSGVYPQPSDWDCGGPQSLTHSTITPEVLSRHLSLLTLDDPDYIVNLNRVKWDYRANRYTAAKSSSLHVLSNIAKQLRKGYDSSTDYCAFEAKIHNENTVSVHLDKSSIKDGHFLLVYHYYAPDGTSRQQVLERDIKSFFPQEDIDTMMFLIDPKWDFKVALNLYENGGPWELWRYYRDTHLNRNDSNSVISNSLDNQNDRASSKSNSFDNEID